MAKRPPAVAREQGKTRKRAVGVALVGVMGAALGYEVYRGFGASHAGQAVAIYFDRAGCARRLDSADCARAFDLARSAHDAHAPREASDAACAAAWESCEAQGGGWRPAMVAVGVARDGRRLAARALARPRGAAPGDYVTTGVGEADDPERRSTASGGGSSGGGRWGSSSSGSSADSGATTHSGGGEHVSTGDAAHGVATPGVARGGFGAVGRGFFSHGG